MYEKLNRIMSPTKLTSDNEVLENFRIGGNKNDQKLPEVIDVNIKTNFTVSSYKSSKIVEKLLFIFVLFFTIIFTVLLFNVRRELQALKYKEQCIKNKISILVTKYEKFNGEVSRFRSHMYYQKYHQPLTTSDKYKRYENSNVAGLIDQADTSVGTQEELDFVSKSNTIKNSSFIPSDDNGDFEISNGDKTFNFTEDTEIKNDNHFNRTILNTVDKNYQAVIQASNQHFDNAGSNSSVKYLNDQMVDNRETDDDINLRSEPRTTRMRRDDERRGKIRTKKKRRPNRSRRRLGPLVATFIGGIPEQHITDAGAIGPWVKMTKNTSHYDLQKFHIVENKKAIEITMNGLYMISAQIFYFGPHTKFSYWILLNSEGQSMTQKVTKCSAVSDVAANEVTCHTNIVLPLRRGDRLQIEQHEHNRLINLREGHSYLQLVLLS